MVKSQPWQGGVATRSKHGGQNTVKPQEGSRGFGTSKSILRDKLPPIRPCLLSMPKQCHQLGTTYPNVQGYWGQLIQATHIGQLTYLNNKILVLFCSWFYQAYGTD